MSNVIATELQVFIAVDICNGRKVDAQPRFAFGATWLHTFPVRRLSISSPND